MGGRERGAYVSLLFYLIAGSYPYCTLLSIYLSISEVAFFRVTLPVMSLQPCRYLFCAIVISQWGLRRLGGFILMKIPLLLFFVGQ